jgi:hypothetical protein
MLRFAFVFMIVLALGCGDRPDSLGDDPGSLDAGALDAGALDAGLDAGIDAGVDAGSDAGLDGGADAGVDAGPDAGPSAATRCAVALMTDLYSGFLPTNPYAVQPMAGPCAVPHDAIEILGCPSNTDGTPSTCQRTRADLAVDLWDAGYASNFIVSGAATHNQWVEADALAALLEQRGVPAKQIFRDLRAMHTDENLYYSDKIMEAQGWSSAIVVSEDPGQLIETALCDSNCCVDLGRLTVLTFPIGGNGAVLGHYVRYPWTQTVSTAECAQIERPIKLMCTKLSSRLSCAGNFQLPP